MRKLVPPGLRIIGLLLILVGVVAAYYGPLEIFVFYLFSEGGRFHYAGFGMGSLWFAALVVQNIGYYVIAALFIPVGIGHVKLRRWALTLAQLYSWFWLGAGIVLMGAFVVLVPSILSGGLDQVLLFQLAAVGTLALIGLIVLPVLALWFYTRDSVRAAFEARDANKYWTERYPFPLLALLLLDVIIILVLHMAAFFQGVFPMFGQIILGRPAAYVIALCILLAGILIYGTLQLKRWAWWGSLAYVSLLALSSVLSFSGQRFDDLINQMNLPVHELEWLGRMVILHDYSLVVPIVAPLLMALGLVIYSRRYF